MRRWAWPAVVALLVAAGAGVWWLMRQDLRLAVYAGALLLAVTMAGAVVAWVRGHRGWSAAMAALVIGVLGAGAAYGWSLNSTLEKIPRIDDSVLSQGERPDKEPSTALNILLLGSDNPTPKVDKPTVAELLADGTWDPGAYRSDSIILLHLSADRKHASMVSIPRDSYVTIYDDKGNPHEDNKINAAFSYYGPFGTLRTVENLTGLRIDHLAMIDFEGFRDVTTALGGVDVYVAQTFTDPNNHYTWEQGWHHLEGQDALRYVRTRYGLQQGDFDRVRRQQNFLRALLTKLTDDGTIGDPATLKATIEAVVPYLTVDSAWSTGDLRSLALDLRHLKPSRITYATVPLDHYETIDGVGAANIIDETRVDELFTAVQDERLPAYLKKYPEDGLGAAEEVR
ncbi:LCP family protein [Nocardioides sp.]|uniref:LCP family glycopolymer transferase n=1 Tax=Nocardioides sp. TaxID=35761 RepID=UPI0035294778